MKKTTRNLLLFCLCAALCIGGVRLAVQKTAHYPALGEAVSIPVNELDGFTLMVEPPTWSLFKGYVIGWEITADSETVYTLTEGAASDFAHLERFVDGAWHLLVREPEPATPFDSTWEIGGSTSGFAGSLVQKYDGYGTNLEEGTYRLVLELHAAVGTADSTADSSTQYLAAEFEIS